MEDSSKVTERRYGPVRHKIVRGRNTEGGYRVDQLRLGPVQLETFRPKLVRGNESSGPSICTGWAWLEWRGRRP